MQKMNNYCKGCISCKAVIRFRCMLATLSENVASADKMPSADLGSDLYTITDIFNRQKQILLSTFKLH